ncbi:unnamed protein product [Staurois parvus]|uniref:CIDE-N domain-containing protein n=1 Tax=Staurois parvus TaxID=386267 RepID=A0ABN9HS71_9NEOB|nr:unnamed protein product [Staurois parvus]
MEKALQVLNLNSTRASVSLVLAKDGTKVDSNEFFLCLPENTEFLALIGSKQWTHTKTDGGTIWMEQESAEDVTNTQLPKAEKSMENYPSIILYSTSDSTDLCTNDAKTPTTRLEWERAECPAIAGLMSAATEDVLQTNAEHEFVLQYISRRKRKAQPKSAEEKAS